MSALEIRSTGELFFHDELVGQITFKKPFIESDVAGEYHPDHPANDGWGGAWECSGCDERDDDINTLEDEVDDLKAKVVALTKERDQLVADQEAKGDVA